MSRQHQIEVRDESATFIGGTKAKRPKQYVEGSTFTILNYELVWRDFDLIQALAPDLIILDEAQRIKKQWDEEPKCDHKNPDWGIETHLARLTSVRFVGSSPISPTNKSKGCKVSEGLAPLGFVGARI